MFKLIQVCFPALYHYAGLLGFLFLVGCASYEKYDAKYPVKGICRSCRPHMIKGVWYTPQTYYDYDETAIASWYGPGFHGKQKANGEIFDQNDISAAHKTLPLPTVVKVTNLTNGKSINLVVDDRGPYVDNRIIDLSVGAAKSLGFYTKGTTRIRVQSLPEQSHALSTHLARIGNRWGYVKGRTWRDVYLDDIAPRFSEDAYEKGRDSHHPVPGYKTSKSGASGAGALSSLSTTHTHAESVPFKEKKLSNQGLDDLISQHMIKEKTVQKASIKTPIKESPKPHYHPKAIPTGPSYFIHLASFVQEKNAKKLVDDLGGLAQASVKKTIVPPGQPFFMVKCGPYPNKDAAEMALTSLEVFGHNPVLFKE